jgi:phosphatidate cytidylyltransferase
MTRVLSGAVLIAIAVAVVWFAPAWLLVGVGIFIGVLAVNELVALARASNLDVSRYAAGLATALVVGSSGAPAGALEMYLMTALVAVAASSLGTWRGGPEALASVSATLFPALYIGLPIAALVGIRTLGGPRVLFLLMLTVIVSDTSQYYTGRLFGRRPLAPAVSPKKTVEGAAGGLVFGTALFAVVGTWWLPALPVAFRVLLGLTVVALGIAGDLFESMLKRSAGVKDSSALIPGHGGVLDRIDALLFAAPVYYIVLKYV